MRRASWRRAAAGAALALAARVMPRCRADWMRAIEAELEFLDDDRVALGWAAGAVVAAIDARIHAMTTGDLRIARPLLAAELALCFAPLTIGWLDGIAAAARLLGDGATGLERLLADGAAPTVATLVLGGALGPLGLLAALRFVAWARPVRIKALRVALVAGPTLLGAGLLAARLGAGVELLGARSADAFDFWSGLVLLSALPVLGALHLLHLGPYPAASLPARGE